MNMSEPQANDKCIDNLISSFGSLGLNSPDSTPSNEIDLSPLKGETATALLHDWASGLDYDPYNNQDLSEWCKMCYFGKISNVKEQVSIAEKDGSLLMLLSFRESKLKLPALLHVINGARVYATDIYVELASFLLEKGADPNIQDFAGFSALHHCFTQYGNETTLEIARKLVCYGANVNVQNRIGCTALFQPCTNLNYAFVEELVSMGCRTDIVDNEGNSCLMIARKLAISGSIKLHSVFSKAYLEYSTLQRLKQSTKSSCAQCGNTASTLKKCSGCLRVSYCNATCQRAAWKSHKVFKLCCTFEEK